MPVRQLPDRHRVGPGGVGRDQLHPGIRGRRPAPAHDPDARRRDRRQWLSTDVVDAFAAAGLECQDPQPLAVDDGTAPFVAAEATRCMVPGACEGCSGRIYSFDNQAELSKAKRYYTDLGNQDPQFVSWLYTKDNILVQLNGRLPEAQATMYRQALMDMR